MKGVVLAGGDGTRLLPLTKIINKHLLPVYDKPMIYYPLDTLVNAGIKDILLVSGRGHAGDFLELLGSGNDFDANITYEVQETSGGIAQALGLAEHWAGKEDVAVILGDNIFQDRINTKFLGGAKIFLKKVSNPGRFGVPVFYDGKLTGVEEKPLFPKTPYAVTGLYFYDPTVFSIIKTLKPSNRGELEISDVNNEYIIRGRMQYSILHGYWSDAGTMESLLAAGIMVRDNK